MNVHHIGYLCKNIGRAKRSFETLGYRAETETVRDDIRKIDICFLIKDGYRIELISPATEDSVVSGLIRKIGNSPYHICYVSDDFEADIETLKQNGYIMIDRPTPAPALGGRRVVFFIHMHAGMIELLDGNGETEL